MSRQQGYSSLWGFISSAVPGPPGTPGPAGPTGAFPSAGITTDSQNKASVQTRSDDANLYAGPAISDALYLNAINQLSVVPWSDTGLPPLATPITQASVLDVVNTFGAGALEIGAFEVQSVSTGAGATIEIESMFGTLVGGFKALGFSAPMGATNLVSTGSLSYTDQDGTGTFIDQTEMTVRETEYRRALIGPAQVGVVDTGAPNVYARFDLTSNGTGPALNMSDGQPFMSIQSYNPITGGRLFNFGDSTLTGSHIRYEITEASTGTYLKVSDVDKVHDIQGLALKPSYLHFASSASPIGPASLKGATIIGIRDVAAAVSIVLPTDYLPGTILWITKETAATTNNVTVTASGGGNLFDGAANIILNKAWETCSVYWTGSQFIILQQK